MTSYASNMSADNIDLISGIKAMKVRMKEKTEMMKKKNEQSAQKEQEAVRLKKRYKEQLAKKKLLKSKTQEGEERLEIVERKIEEYKKRIYEKELFLRESLRFVVGESILEVGRVGEKAEITKKEYKANYETFQKQRKVKVALEAKLINVTNISDAKTARAKILKSELRQMKKEHGAQKAAFQNASESAAANKEELEVLKKAFAIADKREMAALERIEKLTSQIENVEAEMKRVTALRLETTNTIKDILTKLRQKVFTKEGDQS